MMIAKSEQDHRGHGVFSSIKIMYILLLYILQLAEQNYSTTLAVPDHRCLQLLQLGSFSF